MEEKRLDARILKKRLSPNKNEGQHVREKQEICRWSYTVEEFGGKNENRGPGRKRRWKIIV